MESGHYLSTALLNYIDSSDYCVACTALQNIIKLAGNLLLEIVTPLLNYIDSSDYYVACTALQNIIKLAGDFVQYSHTSPQ